MMGLLPVTVISLPFFLIYYFHNLEAEFIFNLRCYLQIVFNYLTNKLSTGVLDRPKPSQTCCRTFNEDSALDASSIGILFFLLRIIFVWIS